MNMDKRKSILNVSVSVGFKFLTMIMAIAVKRFLIDNCGNDVNGLNALYLSIIGFLSVAGFSDLILNEHSLFEHFTSPRNVLTSAP